MKSKLGSDGYDFDRSAETATGPSYGVDSLADTLCDAVADGLPIKPVFTRRDILQLIDPIIRRAMDEIQATRATDEQRATLDRESIWNGVRAIIGYVLASNDHRLALSIVGYASGLFDLQGLSQEELAARHKISRQAFSKNVVRFLAETGLPPSGNMRSKEEREMYRAVQKGRHQRIENTSI